MRNIIFVCTAMVLMLFVVTPVFAEEDATRDEVVAMCNDAAEMLLQDKAAGIAEIANKEGKFVWKNSYVFLMNMEGHMLAHPMIPQLTEKGSLLEVADKNREKPKYIFKEFVDIAQKNGAGWLWYMWPKPNDRTPTEKFTYSKRVGFTDLFVGSGIYK